MSNARRNSNYAFKPIAEQALRLNQTIVPQRLNAALATMGKDVAGLMDKLETGIQVPEFNVLIPWHATKGEVFSLIPEENFGISSGGFWPQLRFTLLGFEALYSLNFVSDPLGRFVEVQYCNYHKRKLRRSFRETVRVLRNELGIPNVVNISWGQLTWRVGSVRVETYITRLSETEKGRGREAHMFSVSNFQSRPVA